MMRIAKRNDGFTLRNIKLIFPLIVMTLIAVACAYAPKQIISMDPPKEFNSERAYQDLEYQVSLGPRTIGSEAHIIVVEWIEEELKSNDWVTETQIFDHNGEKITNIIGKQGEGKPWVIIGAHYDSRFIADQDQNLDKRDEPVPGANDGASGVAVLLELARILPKDLNKQIWLVLFDAEDNGNIPGWDWIIGSKFFVGELDGKPDAVVILDLIGDKDLNIYKEKSSDPRITEGIWRKAEELGYPQFVHEYKYRMIDDHTPFFQAGIPAVVLIDFDYPYWHTTNDTPDKTSAESLGVVGKTIYEWLIEFEY